MMKFRDGRSHPGTIHGILTKDDSLDQWVLLGVLEFMFSYKFGFRTGELGHFWVLKGFLANLMASEELEMG
jgi:hypothetical protein